MSLLRRLEAIGVNTEATQNTAAAPAATDFMLAWDIELKPVGEVLERDYNRKTLDRLKHVMGKLYYEVSFKTELTTGGAAGTANAPLGACFLACGDTETIVGSTSVTYAPTSTLVTNFFGPGKSATIEVYRDGLKHQIAGCIGNCKMTLEAGKVGVCEFTFMGIYAAPTDAAIPTTTYTAILPKIVSSATMTLMGVATHVSSTLEIDFGNEVVMRDDVNSASGVGGFIITGRKPSGSVDPEAVLVATDPFWVDFMTGVEASTSIVVGSGVGYITTITMPKTQWSEQGHGDRNGILTSPGNLVFNQSTGDDWHSIAMTLELSVDMPSRYS